MQNNRKWKDFPKKIVARSLAYQLHSFLWLSKDLKAMNNQSKPVDNYLENTLASYYWL